MQRKEEERIAEARRIAHEKRAEEVATLRRLQQEKIQAKKMREAAAKGFAERKIWDKVFQTSSENKYSYLI